MALTWKKNQHWKYRKKKKLESESSLCRGLPDKTLWGGIRRETRQTIYHLFHLDWRWQWKQRKGEVPCFSPTIKENTSTNYHSHFKKGSKQNSKQFITENTSIQMSRTICNKHTSPIQLIPFWYCGGGGGNCHSSEWHVSLLSVVHIV